MFLQERDLDNLESFQRACGRSWLVESEAVDRAAKLLLAPIPCSVVSDNRMWSRKARCWWRERSMLRNAHIHKVYDPHILWKTHRYRWIFSNFVLRKKVVLTPCILSNERISHSFLAVRKIHLYHYFLLPIMRRLSSIVTIAFIHYSSVNHKYQRRLKAYIKTVESCGQK